MIRAALLGAAVGLVGLPLAAQEASVLIGGVRARYADTVSGTAGFAGLRLSGSIPGAVGVVDASLSRFTSGEWVTQVSASGAGMLRLGNGVSVGLTAVGDANRVQGANWNGEVSAGLLGAIGSGRLLVSLGASIGGVRTVEDSTIDAASVGARFQHGLHGGLSVSGGLAGVLSDTSRYADGSVEFTFTSSRVRASLVGGARIGDLSNDPWVQGQFRFSATPFASIEAALGRYPRDLVGFTEGSFLTLGARVGFTRPSRGAAYPEPPVRVERIDEHLVRITFRHSGRVERVEIAGVWNAWTPTPLAREASGVWVVDLALQPGIYNYAIVLDGDTWTVPDGVLRQPDDFGGEVAILVVR